MMAMHMIKSICVFKRSSTKSIKGFLLTIFLFNSYTGFAQEKLPQLGKNSLLEVIGAMTLEEKARIVAGNAINQPELQGSIMALGHYMYAVPRLGIPPVALNDGPAGLVISPSRAGSPGKSFYATAWPSPRLLSSSWDLELAERVGIAFGREAKEYGVGIILGPGLNIHRNPLCGRNFEYYSEDPLVSGLMASAMVDGIQSNGVGTCLKHFVANDQETQRNSMQTYVSERALREIYLRAFEIPVKKSMPWSIMTSVNYLNGPYTSENYELLTTILRDEWGYEGFVMTDWNGGLDPIMQQKAGNDLITPGAPDQVRTIIEAVRNNELPEAILDKSIERILSVILKTAAFKQYDFSDYPDLESNSELSREAATESMVLLKNNHGTLPFCKDIKRIAVFGNSGYKMFTGGLGSALVKPANENSIDEGLKNAGYILDDELKADYLEYIDNYNQAHPRGHYIKELFEPTPPAPMLPPEKRIIEDKSSEYDIAVVVLGRISGEHTDRRRENFEISLSERQTIDWVSEAFHGKGKKVVVILNITGEIETASWSDNVDAILLAWLPGQEGGNAIADILSGKVNPSGKLTTTFPLSYEDVPSAKNFPGNLYPEKSNRSFFGYPFIPGEVTYEEGIYVGYRYYRSLKVETAFEFGFGLSYTDFDYSDLRLSSKKFRDEILATVTVTNSGKVAGKEVVQLYLTAPAKSMDKPSEELRGFAKTRLLEPGASQSLTFKLIPRDLASFNTSQSAWISEAGKYTLKIGSSCEEILLSKPFILVKSIVVERVHKVLIPPVKIDELKNNGFHGKKQ